MGLYKRDCSPYWWMRLETTKRCLSTKVPIGFTAMEQRESRAVAQSVYHAHNLTGAKIRHGLPVALADMPAPVVLQRSLDRWCYVYFIRDGDTVKIGRAVDPGQRLKALQTAHAEPLTLVAVVPAHVDLEGAIHARFAHRRTQGEWFRLEPDLVAFIEAVQGGANPIVLLW